MADNYIENLLLSLGVDDKSRAGWLALAKAADHTGNVIINVLEKHEELSAASRIFGESAQKTFANTGVLVEQFSKRIANVTEEFTPMNVAIQTGGAALDLLNFKWEESINMMDRWSKLAGNKVAQTVAAAYLGYRLLSSAIAFSAEVFYKSGQAMADQVRTQEKMSESTTRLTGAVTNLSHRTVKLAEIRVYREMGKDLEGLGQAWAATERVGANFTTWLAKQTTGFAAWAASSGVATIALTKLRGAADSLSEVLVGDVSKESAQNTFRAKSFDTIAAAVAHASKNMQSWSAETGIASEELTNSLEMISRRTGDVAASYGLMTVAMEKSFKMQHVNAREMVALMSAIATGANVDTEAMRAFGAEIETSSAKLLSGTERVKFVIDKMLEGRSELEKANFFNSLSKTAVAAYGMMSQTLENYSAREFDLNDRVKQQLTSLAGVRRKTHEEEVSYMRVISRFLEEQNAQYDRQIRAAEGRQQVMSAFSAGGDSTAYYSSSLQEIAKLQAEQKTLEESGSVSAQRRLQENLNQQRAIYGQFFDSLQSDIKRNTSAIADSLGSITELRFSVSSRDLAMVKQLGDGLVDAYKRSFELNKANLDKTFQQLERAQSSEVNLGAMAQRAVQEFAALRSGVAGDLNSASTRVIALQSTIMDTYALEGDYIQGNFQARMRNLEDEIKKLDEIKRLNVGSAETQIMATQRQLQAVKELQNERMRYVEQQRGAVDMVNRDPRERASQTAYDKELPRLLEAIQKSSTGRVSEELRQIMQRMSEPAQAMAKAAQAQVLAQKQGVRIDEVVSRAVQTGSLAAGQKLIAASIKDEDLRTAAYGRLTERASQMANIGGRGLSDDQKITTELRDQIKTLKEANEKQIQNLTERLAQLDKEYADKIAVANKKLEDAQNNLQDNQETLFEALKTEVAALSTNIKDTNTKIGEIPFTTLNDLITQLIAVEKENMQRGQPLEIANDDVMQRLTPSNDREDAAAAQLINMTLGAFEKRLNALFDSGGDADDRDKAFAKLLASLNQLGDVDKLAAKAAKETGVEITEGLKSALLKEFAFQRSELLSRFKTDKTEGLKQERQYLDSPLTLLNSDATDKLSEIFNTRDKEIQEWSKRLQGALDTLSDSQIKALNRLPSTTQGVSPDSKSESENPVVVSAREMTKNAQETVKVAEQQTDLLRKLVEIAGEAIPAIKNIKIPAQRGGELRALADRLSKQNDKEY